MRQRAMMAERDLLACTSQRQHFHIIYYVCTNQSKLGDSLAITISFHFRKKLK